VDQVHTIQLVICLGAGAVAVALVLLQYIRNRRKGSAQATKFLILGLIVVPVLLVGLSLYIGQFWIIATTG
jgi:ABC-type spermidine/putrescine transport system permease subunit II